MNHVFHRDARSEPPVAVAGEGAYLIDRDGKRYFDASGGAAVSCLGHGHRAVIDAIKAQADKLAYAHTAFFSSEPAEALADLLIQKSGRAFERVYFVSGGSEGIEAALKLARQYFLETGETGRELFIGRRQSYHGNTLGALAVGGNAWRRKQFAPLLMNVEHIAPCYAYRDRKEGESEADYGLRVANELEETLARVGPKRVIAFVAEPVVGATLGAVPAVPGYFKRVREICDRYGILLILDEVMCGMGRTGTLFAYEQEHITPDMAVVAKGLGGGYQPIGATLVSKKIFDAVRGGSGFFQHGHTYLGHPLACAAALAVQHTIERENLLANVRTQGAALLAALQQRFAEHPNVGDVRGRGLFIGVELVADRAAKSSFDPALKLHARIKREAFARGLICYPMGGTIDGLHGDHVMLAPPYIIDGTHIAEIVDKLSSAIEAALAGLSA
ncbi:MAG: aspartate aminotransferase family protein [Betaproteobacteria bacterium]|nr:aspartate aminotransferase family protein [Betaproteobacteria bacterium]